MAGECRNDGGIGKCGFELPEQMDPLFALTLAGIDQERAIRESGIGATRRGIAGLWRHDPGR